MNNYFFNTKVYKFLEKTSEFNFKSKTSMSVNAILGAMFGDIAGSFYEFHNTKDYNFKLLSRKSSYTDDSILTLATADWLTHGGSISSYYDVFGNKYHGGFGGYGSGFRAWLAKEKKEPYGSCGNGSAMRVSPVGCFFNTMEETLEWAKKSAECTHNDPDGIMGAQFVAAAIFLLRNGHTKEETKDWLSKNFSYDLNLTYEGLHETYRWSSVNSSTVPQAFACFFDSTNFEDAIRKAISIGGDSDTIGAICGSMAGAFYGIPDKFIEEIYRRIPQDFVDVINNFNVEVTKKGGVFNS